MEENIFYKFLTRHITVFVSFVLILGILILSVKGTDTPATPKNINDNLRSETMPFELTHETGSFALLASVVDNRSVYLSNEVAKYVKPDLGYYNGKFVSIFPPGTSYLAIPMYMIGKLYGYEQYFAFLSSALAAFFSCIFIYRIVNTLTGSIYPGVISGMAYLFGTSAFPYATTLYQHHFVALALLMGIYFLTKERSFKNNAAVFFIAGILFFVEYQSLLFYLPVLIMLVFKNIRIRELQNKLTVSLNTGLFAGFIFLAISLLPFFIYNKTTYGKIFALAGTVQGTRDAIEDPETGELVIPKATHEKSVSGFFNIYKMPNSMSVLLTGKDRGLIYFSPVILFSLIGIWPLMKKKKDVSYAVFSMTALIFILYGMWGDPWGGWAFGTRYLIPAFAVMSIPLGVAINAYGKKWYFTVPFLAVFLYSTFINLTGALTTNKIPPSVEEDSQNYPQYTFLYNIKLAYEGKTSSFIYKTYMNNINFRTYYYSLFLTIVLLTGINYILFLKEKHENI